MKKIINLLLTFCLLGSTVYAQNSSTPHLSKPLSSETVSNIFARTSGGNIQVSGVSAREARIEVHIASSNNKTLSQEQINTRLKDDYTLTIEVTDHKLTATAEPKRTFINGRQSLSISFKIYVPAAVSTDLSTSGGSIELRNLHGTQDFHTSGGGISLSKITGKVRGKTSGGGITVEDSKDDITLSTSGGNIQASNCSGTLRLNTSGGQIELERLDGDIEAETSGGPIKGEGIRGKLFARTSGGNIKLHNMACGIDVSTSGGSIEADIVEVVAAVTVNNSGGNVNLKMPANKGLNLRLRGENISAIDLTNFTGDRDDNSINGKVNGGGIPVSVSTSGNISFSMK
ncbi:MAG TPA: hypothetical protein VK658_20070 [Chryseolinea sp.]|nr:hypothetical protein [Chryseolinea sp.]